MNLDEYKDQSVPMSLRALGLLGLFQNAGRVIPTNELRSQVKEGRDAILKAKRELRRDHHRRTVTQMPKGRKS